MEASISARQVITGSSRTEASHRCGLCDKIFERRDLRDRHKKRCIQSYSRPKRSKKRSCNACAASKLGCNLGYPACSRCANRNIACEYPPHIAQLQAQQQTFSTNGPDENGISPCDLGFAEMHAIFTSQLTSGSAERSRTTTGSVVSEGESIGNTIGISWPTSHDDSMDHSQDAVIEGLFPGNDLESPSEDMFDLLGSFGMPGSNSIPGSIQDFSMHGGHQPLFQPISWKPPLPFPNTIDNLPLQSPSTQSTSYTISPASSSEPTNVLTETRSSWQLPIVQRNRTRSTNQPVEQPECPFHKIGTDDKLVGLLKSYIQTMLHKGRYPPFVHPKLYKCVEGDVIESLANAFCSLAAKNAALPSSAGFVNLMIDSERSRLIKAFRSWGKSDIEGLAAVHAMSIYQIISLFDSTEEQARAAELQQPFFLKMARRLAQQFLLPEQKIIPDATEATWRKWILLESLKRALLVVNIINTLGYRTQQMNGFYFEPLGDDLVMNLQAPAPECLWTARSASDWATKYAHLDSSDQILCNITVAQLRDLVNPTILRTPGSPTLEFDNLSEFTKLSLASLAVEIPDD